MRRRTSPVQIVHFPCLQLNVRLRCKQCHIGASRTCRTPFAARVADRAATCPHPPPPAGPAKCVTPSRERPPHFAAYDRQAGASEAGGRQGPPRRRNRSREQRTPLEATSSDRRRRIPHRDITAPASAGLSPRMSRPIRCVNHRGWWRGFTGAKWRWPTPVVRAGYGRRWVSRGCRSRARARVASAQARTPSARGTTSR